MTMQAKEKYGGAASAAVVVRDMLVAAPFIRPNGSPSSRRLRRDLKGLPATLGQGPMRGPLRAGQHTAARGRAVHPPPTGARHPGARAGIFDDAAC
ncbi:hypothetical protein GCM10028786_14040 [Flaviaesturariibacter terrae]